MTTLGDVFRRDGPGYRARWGSQLSTQQIATMHAIAACRTETLGGQLYRFRVARSNTRSLAMPDGQVTFRSQDGETRQTRPGTLPAETCIERFRQHILPKGVVTVGDDGLLRVGARQPLVQLRAQRGLQQRMVALQPPDDERPAPVARLATSCPRCGHELRRERVLPPPRAPPVHAPVP